MIKIGVIGYGTIGKRVSDAVSLQNDMKLVGVTGNNYNYKIEVAKKKGIKIFSADRTGENLKKNNIYLSGNIYDLVKECDIVVDCTPKGVGRKNKEIYLNYDKKAIFQGGESLEVADTSFVAQCNYNQSINKDYVRVVSCNTTGLCRTLHAVNQQYGIENVHATMIRRAADPWDIHHGPINSIVPVLELPSHHGPDVRTVLPEFSVFTTAMTVPTTIMHVHSVTVDLKNPATDEDVIELFRNTTRIKIVRNAEKIRSTAEIIEFAKDLGRPRGDMPETCVWDKAIGTWGNKLFYLQAIHQESNVVLETIDAIRAAMGFPNAQESIKETNKSMGVN